MDKQKQFYFYPILIAIFVAVGVFGVAIDYWLEQTFYLDPCDHQVHGYRIFNFWTWFVVFIISAFGIADYFGKFD